MVLATQRPRLAALIAEVAIAWETVESSQARLLEFLLSGGFKEQRMRPDPIANEIYSAVTTSQQRLGILRRVLRVRIADASVRKRLEEIVNLVNTARGFRNRFIHANWAVSDDAHYRDKIISFPRNRPSNCGKAQPYGEEQIRQAIDVILNAEAQLEGLYGWVSHILDDGLPSKEFFVTLVDPSKAAK